MNKKNKLNKASSIAALTSAAMALPAISQLAAAESAPDKSQLSYRYSHYQEDDLSNTQVLSGTKERYEIDSHQFRLITALDEDTAITVDALYETLTGASPYSTVAIGDQKQLIMTGASISESRTDVAVAIENFAATSSTTYSVGLSQEDDYSSINIGIEKALDQNKITSYNMGFDLSLDEIEPIQTEGVNRIKSKDKWFANLYASLSRVISKRWQLQAGIAFGQHDGYLSDPYKSIDNRPDNKQVLIFMGRSRYFAKTLNAAIHTDYRYYVDDWGIDSHTLDVAYYQYLSDQIQVVPRVRYYSQSQADFYVETDSATRRGYQSSDFQLSPFGSLSYGLDLRYSSKSYDLTVSLESYESDGDYALKNVSQENPGLVSYSLLSFGVDYRY
ncbi:MAG: DUF3570 domain-containing protein [Pseudomonadales bacterium]|nr:DUF3570 domain-containing protein [Pseudomonadales bacterium]